MLSPPEKAVNAEENCYNASVLALPYSESNLKDSPKLKTGSGNVL